MNVLVTGGAGFIGSNLADKLKLFDHKVFIVDNFSTGLRRFISPGIEVFEMDLKSKDLLADLMKKEKIDIVFHLAANADVRFGFDHRFKDIQENIINTSNVLEAMYLADVRRIVFSSTGSVYGESNQIPTPENANMQKQTSLYAASKLAAEGLITSYCEAFGWDAWIFRFVSILGPRYSHGHVYDFYLQLMKDPKKLFVLGDGYQTKSYLHINDCIDGMLIAIKSTKGGIFNLGTEEVFTVRQSVKTICEFLGIDPNVAIYSGGRQGWVGDNPLIYLDTLAIRSLGWEPKWSIQDSIIDTVKFLKENNWIFKERK